MDMTTKILIFMLKICFLLVCVGQQCDSSCSGGCDVLTRACHNCTDSTYDRFCDAACSKFCHSSCDRYSGNCDSCKSGRYASWCLESCSAGCSSECDMETGNCSLCKAGWYGHWCNVPCPRGCYGACNKITGDCLSCKDGYYGRHCNVPCVEKDCPGGCDQFYGTCSKCPPGFYGILCNRACSINCKELSCDSFNGRCYDCKQGYFGFNCNQSCPVNCNGICNFQTGHCFSCKVGYYGENCSSQCPVNCVGPCKQLGTCFWCVNGFCGDQCKQNCPQHCLSSCDQTKKTCFTCAEGYWGDYCNETCGVNCVGPCHKNISRCSSCKPGWYGLNCEQQCPSTCKNDSCTPVGTCLSCNNGFYGDRCQMECADCENNTCTQQDGVCTVDCKTGSDCDDTYSSTSTSKSPGLTTQTVSAVTSTDSGSLATITTKITTTEMSIQPDKGDNYLLLIIIVLLSVLVMLGFGGIVFYILKKRGPAKAEEDFQQENVYDNIYHDICENTYSDAEGISDNVNPEAPRAIGQNNMTNVETEPEDRESTTHSYDDLENVIEDTQNLASDDGSLYQPNMVIRDDNDGTNRNVLHTRSEIEIPSASSQVLSPSNIYYAENENLEAHIQVVRNTNLISSDRLFNASGSTLSSGYIRVSPTQKISDKAGNGSNAIETSRAHIINLDRLSTASGSTVASGYTQVLPPRRGISNTGNGPKSVENPEVLGIRNILDINRDNDTNGSPEASGSTLSSGYNRVSAPLTYFDIAGNNSRGMENSEKKSLINSDAEHSDNDTGSLSEGAGNKLPVGYGQHKMDNAAHVGLNNTNVPNKQRDANYCVVIPMDSLDKFSAQKANKAVTDKSTAEITEYTDRQSRSSDYISVT